MLSALLWSLMIMLIFYFSLSRFLMSAINLRWHYRKCLVSAGMVIRLSWFRKTGLVSFDPSVNSGAIDIKMGLLILEEKWSFTLLQFSVSSEFDNCSYIAFFVKTISEHLWFFMWNLFPQNCTLSLWMCFVILLRYGSQLLSVSPNFCLNCRSCRNRYVSLLVLHLLLLELFVNLRNIL